MTDKGIPVSIIEANIIYFNSIIMKGLKQINEEINDGDKNN